MRETSRLEGKATFECVETNFSFNRCLRLGSVEAPRLWQEMATQLLANVEENFGVLPDFEGERAHQICSFMWADNFWIMSHSEGDLDQMLRDLSEEAEKLDVAPKPAGLWRTSTYKPQERCDLSIDTKSGRHRFPSEGEFKIFGCAMNRQGQAPDALEERMQSANKAHWKDIMINNSKDIPWKIKCRRLFDIFSFASENWTWTPKTLERIKEWETKTMLGLFRCERKQEDTWADYYTRTCKTARKYGYSWFTLSV